MISTLGPFLLAASIQVATTTTVPQDTYRDEGVRVILTTAAAARERIYVGLNVARFRRERGLFDGERGPYPLGSGWRPLHRMNRRPLPGAPGRQ